MKKTILLSWGVAAVVLSMAGCGGGGGGSAPSGQRLIFATSLHLDSLHVFRRNADDSLVEVTSVATGDAPTGVVVSPNKKWLIVSHNSAAHLRVYEIQPNGHLNAGPVPIVPLPSPARNLALSASRNVVYAACADADKVLGYHINNDGTLSMVAEAGSIDEPTAVAVSPAGDHLYVGIAPNRVAQYSVALNGNLTPMAPTSVLGVFDPHTIAVHPSGKYVYAGSSNHTQVVQFRCQAGALLTQIPNSANSTANAAIAKVDRRGKTLLLTNTESQNLIAMQISSSGLLSARPPVPYSFGVGIAVMTPAPDRDIVYVASEGSPKIALYDLASDGTLTYRTEFTTTGGSYYGMAFATLPALP